MALCSEGGRGLCNSHVRSEIKIMVNYGFHKVWIRRGRFLVSEEFFFVRISKVLTAEIAGKVLGVACDTRTFWYEFNNRWSMRIVLKMSGASPRT